METMIPVFFQLQDLKDIFNSIKEIHYVPNYYIFDLIN